MLMNMKMEESLKVKHDYDPPKHRGKYGDHHKKNARRYKDIDEPEIKIKVPKVI
jgi:hypothetical protein